MSSCGVGRRGLRGRGGSGRAGTVRHSLLRRGFEKPRELAAAEVQVVLVRHDDRQPRLPRLLNLLGQPRVADEAVLVEIEKHVRRGGRPIIGGGDRETGKGGGDLVGQVQRPRIGRRGPERGCRKGERLALEFARHAEREGGLVHIGGRAEEQGLWFKCGWSGDREDRVAAGCGPAAPRR